MDVVIETRDGKRCVEDGVSNDIDTTSSRACGSNDVSLKSTRSPVTENVGKIVHVSRHGGGGKLEVVGRSTEQESKSSWHDEPGYDQQGLWDPSGTQTHVMNVKLYHPREHYQEIEDGKNIVYRYVTHDVYGARLFFLWLAGHSLGSRVLTAGIAVVWVVVVRMFLFIHIRVSCKISVYTGPAYQAGPGGLSRENLSVVGYVSLFPFGTPSPERWDEQLRNRLVSTERASL